MKKCKFCGKEFKPRFGREVYCCRKCYFDNIKSRRIKTKCKQCGKDIEFIKSVFRGHGEHCCSKACLSKSMTIHYIETRVCAYCKEEYQMTTKRKTRYCCTDCANRANFKKVV